MKPTANQPKTLDLVDRIIGYLQKNIGMTQGFEQQGAINWADIENKLRREFGGAGYIKKDGAAKPTASDILRAFNGRNPSEAARVLGISRATLYRKIKQPGKNK
jgi:transcriptional regulator of acetoin/glycerol metabolism